MFKHCVLLFFLSLLFFCFVAHCLVVLPTLCSCLVWNCCALGQVLLWLDLKGCSYRRCISAKPKKKPHLLQSVEQLSLALRAVETVWLWNSESRQGGTRANRVSSVQWSSSQTQTGCEDLFTPFPVSLHHILSPKRQYEACLRESGLHSLCAYVCVCPSCGFECSVVGCCDYKPDRRLKAFHLTALF